LRRNASRLVRKVAVVLALGAASVVTLGLGCSDPPRAKAPEFELTYAPNPPVPGERLAVRLSGSNLGVVEIYQGSALLARVVNPLSEQVPADFYVYRALDATPPRAVAFDPYGNRVEVAGRPSGTVPAPSDAGVKDAAVADASKVDAGPSTTYTKTCRGFTDTTSLPEDAGLPCGPSGLAVQLAVFNKTGEGLDVFATGFQAGVCETIGLARMFVGEERTLTKLVDNQTLTLQKFDGTVIRKLRVAPGETGPCNLLVE
jgi:hypothetical protein